MPQPIKNSPETEGNVCSTLVLCKKIPEYSQLADETYINLEPIYMQKNVFVFVYFFGPKNVKNCLILAQKVAPMQNDQYLYTSEYNIKCVRLLG